MNTRHVVAAAFAVTAFLAGAAGTASAGRVSPTHPYTDPADYCESDWVDIYEQELETTYGQCPVKAGPDGEGDYRPHGSTPPFPHP